MASQNNCFLLSMYCAVGVHNGVVEKLRQKLNAKWIESSPCAAHTFSLVGSQAAYTLTGKHC